METILKFMSAHHAKLDAIFTEFTKEQSNDLVRAIPLFHNFRVELQRHIVWEEEVLFPGFEGKTGMQGSGPTAVMRAEHRQIKEFLEEIQTKLLESELEGIDKPEKDLLDILYSHNQKEENILYPAIDNLLTNEEREKAITEMTNIPPDDMKKYCQ